MMISDDNKKSFAKMMKGRAVYLALGACVLAAGLVSYSAAGPKQNPGVGVTQRPETSTWVHISERVLPEAAAPTAPREVTAAPEPAEAPGAAPVFDNAAAPVESTSVPEKQIAFTLPLHGGTGKDFSMGVPVFSATMNDYRTHNGVDFKAEAGAPVTAIAEGKVIAVSSDALYGNVVTVDHGGGVVSSVSGLAAEGLIHEGADVYNETVLGVVGEIPLEKADGAHIHLEIRVNGTLQDPLEVMGCTGGEND